MRGDDVTTDKIFGFDTIYGRDGEHTERYMTRFWIGHLRLHLFWRGDNDPDAHDHPWDFWTFPLRSYVEEVVEPVYNDSIRRFVRGLNGEKIEVTPLGGVLVGYKRRRQVVRAFRLHFRPAKHTHRVLGVWTRSGWIGGEEKWLHEFEERGFMPTIVWRSGQERKWGFLKERSGRWCWTPWKEYIFGGGKDAPCKPGE